MLLAYDVSKNFLSTELLFSKKNVKQLISFTTEGSSINYMILYNHYLAVKV